jgi:hypothetical protein
MTTSDLVVGELVPVKSCARPAGGKLRAVRCVSVGPASIYARAHGAIARVNAPPHFFDWTAFMALRTITSIVTIASFTLMLARHIPVALDALIVNPRTNLAPALSHSVQLIVFRIDLQINLFVFGGARTVAEHTDGARNDALLGVLTFAGMGVRISNDFDTVHCRQIPAMEIGVILRNEY